MKNKRKDNLKELLQIKNSTETSADLYFYGDIVSSWLGAWDDTDQYPEKVKDFLDEAKGKELNIYVNSGGGSVFAGMAIYNMLKRHEGNKTVYVDGLAGSISSVIALAGDKIVIPSNAYMMIHKPWNYSWGNANELREQADMLDKIEEGILNVYSENLKEGVDIEQIKEMVNNETWLTGEDASKYFNIELSTTIEAVACVSDYYDNYGKVPKNIKNNSNESSKKLNDELEKEKLLLQIELI
ncbi:ATP-dependent Clp protease proteolytic subunit [Terrisporobacter petrolearius]|uniref:ATP-dependent Clp protease proteolytic subunit n=1 Tax=Terrisporobacter petrolearius TaxID=1460447 RepID=A0ABZ3FDZ3_9FIRM